MSATDMSAETWRDMADQLTPEQVAYLERSELFPVPSLNGIVDPERQRGLLLFGAREFAEQNVAAERFRHVQAPAGADQVDAWWPGEHDDDSWSRAWWGTARAVDIASASSPFMVMLSGTQWSDGRGETGVTVEAGDNLLTACEARRLAAALMEAAAELDTLSAGVESAEVVR